MSRPAGTRTGADLMAVAAATCVAGLLGAYRLGWLPLWMDEAWSEWFAHRGLGEAWRLTRDYDTHPPLYQTLLSAWIARTGASEAALRGLSVAFMAATVPLVYLIGRTVARGGRARLVGAIGAALFALSPLQVAYAQEARPYAALTFAVALMIYGACSLLRRDAPRPATAGAAGGSWTAPLRSPGWWAFVAGSALTLWLHNTAVLAVASVWAVVLAAGIAGARADPALLRQLVIGGVVTALLYAPFLPYLIDQAGRVSQGFWIARPSLHALQDAVLFLFGSGFGYTGVAAVVFCTLAAFGLRSLDDAGDRWMVILLAAAALAPILLQFGISRIDRPIFLPRTLVFVLVPFVVCVAAGIAGMRSLRGRVVAGTAAVALLLGGLHHYYSTHTKEPWGRIAARVAALAGERVIVLTVPNYAAIPLRYYLPDRSLPRGVLRPLPGEFPSATGAPIPAGVRGAPRMTTADLAAIREELRGADSVLLVARNEVLYDPDGVVPTMLTGLGFRETMRESYRSGLITIRLLDRGGAR
jgi:mannosyltransferase